MASHQGKDFASRCCHGDGCLGCSAKLLPCSMKKEIDEDELAHRDSMELWKKSWHAQT